VLWKDIIGTVPNRINFIDIFIYYL
jgi:hypothetical protein